MIRSCLYLLKKIWKYSKFRVLFSFAVIIVGGVNSLIDVLFYKYMIDGISAHKSYIYILGILGVRIVVLIVYQCIQCLSNEILFPTCELKIAKGLSRELFEKVKSIDITTVDDPEFYDKYSRAYNEIEFRTKVLLYTLTYMLQVALQVALVGVALVYIHPVVVAIAIIGATLTMFANIYRAKLNAEYNKKQTVFGRGLDYIKRVFYLPQYAKDIRTTNISEVLYDRYDKFMIHQKNVIRKNGPRVALAKITGECIFFIMGTGATSAFMIYQVYKGILGIGDFVSANYAVASLSNNLLAVANCIPQLMEHALFIDNYIEVMEYESKIKEDKDAVNVNPKKSSQIELKNVTYKYPNAENNALEQINLLIRPGEKIGLVGENGAGKSTLLKLILRLYEPNEGELSLDGKPYCKITKKSLQNSFAVVEQDFQHYAFSIREDVSFESDEHSSENRVYDALKKVDLLDVIKQLPNDIDSNLSNEFDEEGISLSGGQLQRLAIARMVYQDSGILIMDEPSSALDPVSEAKIFEIIHKLAENKTLILVSHRLSGVKDMDRILFMDQGKIEESGTHQQLMEQDGKYANMFRIQAERYGEDFERSEE